MFPGGTEQEDEVLFEQEDEVLFMDCALAMAFWGSELLLDSNDSYLGIL